MFRITSEYCKAIVLVFLKSVCMSSSFVPFLSF